MRKDDEQKTNDAWQLLSCLMDVGYRDKKHSIKVMEEYLEKNRNYLPQNTKEAIQSLISLFEKDLRGEE